MVFTAAMGMASLVGIQGVSSFLSGKSSSKYQAKLAEYQNKLNAVNSMIQSDAINRNERKLEQQTMAAKHSLQQQNMLNKGAANVAAAVEGVEGNSVGQTLATIDQSTANQMYGVELDAKYQQYQYSSQKAGLLVSSAANYIPPPQQPSLMNSLVNTAVSSASAYYTFKGSGGGTAPKTAPKTN